MTQLATVTGMRCARCKMKVTHALLDLDGVEQAHVDLQAGQATIDGQHFTQAQLNAVFDGTKFAVTDVTDIES